MIIKKDYLRQLRNFLTYAFRRQSLYFCCLVFALFLFVSDSCVYVIFQRFHGLIHAQSAAVDGQIIVTGIAPFYLAMAVMVRFSATILLDHALLCMSRIKLIDLHNTLDLGFSVS